MRAKPPHRRVFMQQRRLTTSGAPDRRDLPGGEGHVRRCVPGKRVLSGRFAPVYSATDAAGRAVMP